MIDSYKNIGITVGLSTKEMSATQLQIIQTNKTQEHPNGYGNRSGYTSELVYEIKGL